LLKTPLKKLMDDLSGRFPELAEGDIELLASEHLGIPRLDIYLRGDRGITAAEVETLERLCERRLAGEPLQYILGKAWFRNLTLKVGPGVLIPRPETEVMVDLAIALAPPKPKICDLGTGSGAVAIALATEINDAEVAAVDISPNALKYAELNKTANSAENLKLFHGDLFEPLGSATFNVVTANLPYVSPALFEKLPREVRGFEPESALLAGTDGLDLIRRAAREAFERILPNGAAIFEISPEQADSALSLLDSAGFAETWIETDLTGRKRFAIGKLEN